MKISVAKSVILVLHFCLFVNCKLYFSEFFNLLQKIIKISSEKYYYKIINNFIVRQKINYLYLNWNIGSLDPLLRLNVE